MRARAGLEFAHGDAVIAAAKARKSAQPLRVSLGALDLPVLRQVLQQRVQVQMSRVDVQRCLLYTSRCV